MIKTDCFMKRQYSHFCLLVNEIVDRVIEYINDADAYEEAPSLIIIPGLFEARMDAPEPGFEHELVPVTKFVFTDKKEGLLPDLDAIHEYASGFFDLRRSA